jgi:hypothetical protein
LQLSGLVENGLLTLKPKKNNISNQSSISEEEIVSKDTKESSKKQSSIQEAFFKFVNPKNISNTKKTNKKTIEQEITQEPTLASHLAKT